MDDVVLAGAMAEAVSASAAVLGVLATLFVGWLGWRAVVPHRTMTYSFEVTPLLSEELPNLAVSLGDRPLTQPHTATVRIKNVGNREIDVNTFNGEPLELGMNARIVSILTRDAGLHRRVPPTSARGEVLYIDPYVIRKDQTLVYKLLLDGDEPSVTPRHTLSASLRERREPNMGRRRGLAIAFTVLVFVTMISTLILATRQMQHLDRLVQHDRKVIQHYRDQGYQEGQSDAKRGIVRPHATGSSFP
ncbi:hypothetical protein ACFZC3_15275 [Streptomyces sp. NPDC007903]|uniref:hypothetical protein n=1 Tax=Streptomyces sp. NPDC007903 TaxID=3364786 RepID=UPI0036E6FD0C